MNAYKKRWAKEFLAKGHTPKEAYIKAQLKWIALDPTPSTRQKEFQLNMLILGHR